MSSHWSLVAFTLLFQAAAGSIWCTQAAMLFSGNVTDSPSLNCHFTSALIAAIAGMAAAMAHLGNPRACFHAVANIRNSWLSRELLTALFFAGILAFLAVTGPFRPRELDGPSVSVAALSALATLYVMSKVYRLKTVPPWNHGGTLLNFLGSALVLGGLLFNLVEIICPVSLSNTSLYPTADISQRTAFIAIVAGSMIKMAAAGIHPPEQKRAGDRIGRIWAAFQGLGIFFATASLFLADSKDLQLALFSLTAVVLVSAEVFHRIRFYHLYHRIGL